MNPRALIARAWGMDAQEIRARVECAVRTHAGRVRFAVVRPGWERERLRDALDPSSGPLVAEALNAARHGDWLAAHRVLARHIAARRSPWPLTAASRPRLSHEISLAFPDAPERAREAADRILEGRLHVLGYRNVAVGDPPAWRRDPIHGRTAPRAYWASIKYLDPAIGDHKIIWEINRHQHFLTLGTAYWLTGDTKYRDGFVRQVEDWLQQNPPLVGINWSSMLELAFRTLSWTWATEFFATSADSDASPWLVDLLLGVDKQLSHIARNLSTYFSPNTHLSGEALALYAVSMAFPELRRSARRAALGRDVLLRESKRQVLGDGGHVELSPHYHRYSTEFYLLAGMVARAAGDNAAPAFEGTAHRQAAYLRTIADDDGRLPTIGDDDGGRLFKFEDGPAWDASATLSVAAATLSDHSLAVRTPTAEVFWVLGRTPQHTDVGAAPAPWPSRLLAESGYFVSRGGRGNHLVFDAGPHGYLNGGHAHSDALSIVLTVRGRPFLIDPGTATYTMDRTVRDRHRAARMHNTIVIDGRDPSAPAGPFQWSRRSDARVLAARTGGDLDFAAGAVCGRGGSHVRAVVALHGFGWLFVDRVVSVEPVTAEVWWHLHPMWEVSASSDGATAESRDGITLALAFSKGDVSVSRAPDVAAASFEYGSQDVGTAIRVQHRGSGPFALACAVPDPVAMHPGFRVAEVESCSPGIPGWAAVAFVIQDRSGQSLTVELFFPDSREAEPDDRWPQPCIHSTRTNDMAVCVE